MNGYNHAFVIENDATQNGQTLWFRGRTSEGGFSQFAGNGNIAPNFLSRGAVRFLPAHWHHPLNTFTYSSVSVVRVAPIPVSSVVLRHPLYFRPNSQSQNRVRFRSH